MVQPASTKRVAEAAAELGLDIEIREFPEGTRSAEDAAQAIGVAVGQIVKSLVFVVDGRPVICFVSGPNRLDTGKLAGITGATEVDRAGADEVREATGYAVGGVPPQPQELDNNAMSTLLRVRHRLGSRRHRDDGVRHPATDACERLQSIVADIKESP
jgi:prolyl-tRNA editing enzyme YbaK/EbsC (Cys-tRNA(Pro) deacylase)